MTEKCIDANYCNTVCMQILMEGLEGGGLPVLLCGWNILQLTIIILYFVINCTFRDYVEKSEAPSAIF